MTAAGDGAASTGAVVRKPPRNEPAGDVGERSSAFSYGDFVDAKGACDESRGAWRER
jgi:hypothetical protein